MNLIAARCPNCGANIEISPEMEATKCKSCGSAILVEDAIRKYKVEINGSVKFNENVEPLLKSANGFLSLGKWEEALDIFAKVVKIDSTDYRGWWGLFLAKIQNGASIKDMPYYELDYSDGLNAFRLAPQDKRQEIQYYLQNSLGILNPVKPMYQMMIIREHQSKAKSMGIVLKLEGGHEFIMNYNQSKAFNIQEGKITIFARHELAKRYDEFQINISKDTKMYVRFGSAFTLRTFVPIEARFE